jgi:CRP-like cAMP-binding protein
MAIDRELIGEAKIFAELSDQVVDEFAAAGKEVTFADEEVVYAELTESTGIYLVVEGELRHTFALANAGAEMEDFMTGPGEISNAVRLFADGPDFVSCLAEGDVRVISWEKDAVRAICDRHPDAGYRIVCRIAAILCQRMLRFNQLLLDNMSWGLE